MTVHFDDVQQIPDDGRYFCRAWRLRDRTTGRVLTDEELVRLASESLDRGDDFRPDLETYAGIGQTPEEAQQKLDVLLKEHGWT